jgi:hypothetical protein
VIFWPCIWEVVGSNPIHDTNYGDWCCVCTHLYTHTHAHTHTHTRVHTHVKISFFTFHFMFLKITTYKTTNLNRMCITVWHSMLDKVTLRYSLFKSNLYLKSEALKEMGIKIWSCGTSTFTGTCYFHLQEGRWGSKFLHYDGIHVSLVLRLSCFSWY